MCSQATFEQSLEEDSTAAVHLDLQEAGLLSDRSMWRFQNGAAVRNAYIPKGYLFLSAWCRVVATFWKIIFFWERQHVPVDGRYFWFEASNH